MAVVGGEHQCGFAGFVDGVVGDAALQQRFDLGGIARAGGGKQFL